MRLTRRRRGMAFVVGLLLPAMALAPIAGVAQPQPSPVQEETAGADRAPGPTDRAQGPAARRGTALPEPELADPERPRPTVAVQGVPLEEPVDPDAYVCGRGDVFELQFWGQQNFSLRVPVGLTGRMFVWKVGYVEVAGKTLTEARAVIRKTVLRFYPGLNFDVQLATPRMFLVHVVDNVRYPGIYPARATDRVSALLERAGGITKALVKKKAGEDPAERGENRVTTGGNGSQRRVEVRRRNGTVLVADLLMYFHAGDKAQNPYVLDGDVIRVPFEQLAASIAGPVNRPGRYELTGTKDLAELVALAGGLKSAVTGRLPIRIVRRNQAERDQVIEVPFAGRGAVVPAVPLRDDDRVTVPSAEELQRGVFIVGAILGGKLADESTSIRRMEFEEGDTVRSLLERSGGIGPNADLKGAYIIRGDGEKPTLIQVDLEALLIRRDLTTDRRIEMGDTLMVPYKRRGVTVEGSVLRPGVYQYNPRLTMREYIQNAGGPSKMARGESAIRVVTPTGETRRSEDKPVIRPGDTIVVPERTFSRSEVVQLIITGVTLAITTFALVLTARK